MCEYETRNILGIERQVCVPGDGMPAHVLETGSLRDNLDDIVELYDHDMNEFTKAPMEETAIIGICTRCEESMKELIGNAEGLIRMEGVDDDLKQYCIQVMQRAYKEADMRKKSMRVRMNFLLSKEPNNEKLYQDLRKIQLKCIHTVQCAMNSLASYEKRLKEGRFFENKVEKMEQEAVELAEKVRRATPEGHTYRPSMIYPKTITPPGEPVPEYPEVMQRYLDIPIEVKDYDTELDEFVLPKGYVSPDGMLDDRSVVWHPETHEVEMGFVGQPREVWNYVKHRDDREVFKPGSWEAEYQMRLFDQLLAKAMPKGLFE